MIIYVVERRKFVDESLQPQAAMSEEELRDFAKRYIIRRLAENQNDAIEELASYLGNWLYIRKELEKLPWDSIETNPGGSDE